MFSALGLVICTLFFGEIQGTSIHDHGLKTPLGTKLMSKVRFGKVPEQLHSMEYKNTLASLRSELKRGKGCYGQSRETMPQISWLG